MIIFNIIKLTLRMCVVVVIMMGSGIVGVVGAFEVVERQQQGHKERPEYPTALNPFSNQYNLVEAAKKGKVDVFRDYLVQHSSLDINSVKDAQHNNLLMVAAEYGQSEVVDFLLSGNNLAKVKWFVTNTPYFNLNSGDIEIKNMQGNTALMLAVGGLLKLFVQKQNLNEDQEQFIQSGELLDLVDCFSGNSYEDTVSRIDAKLKSYKYIIQKLLERGADINTKNKFGQTPLMYAASFNNVAMVHMLLQHNRFNPLKKNKVNINETDDFGDTALMYACLNGTPDMVKLLISYGANLKVHNSVGDTPLMKAIRAGNFTVVSLLLHPSFVGSLVGKKVEINTHNTEGDTPLMLALMSSNEDIIAQLVKYGADINVKNSKGETVLMRAVIDNKQEVFDILLSCGSALRLYTNSVDLNARDNQGNTALMWAAHHGRSDMVKQLLTRGIGARWLKGAVGIDMQNNNGETALHMALHNHKYDTARVLLELGANAYIEDKIGKNPVAIVNGNIHNVDVQKFKLKVLVDQQRFNKIRYLMSQRVNTVCRYLPRPYWPERLRVFGRKGSKQEAPKAPNVPVVEDQDPGI